MDLTNVESAMRQFTFNTGRALVMFLLAAGIAACCNEEDQIRYFPDEAITWYNTRDTVLFIDSGSGQQEKFATCLRDTVGSVTEKEGICSSFDYDYSIAYHLDRDRCSSGTSFVVQVSPDTVIEITRIRPGQDDVFYRVRYERSAEETMELCGQVHEGVVEVRNITAVFEEPILFSLRNGILQYPLEGAFFCLEMD